MKIYEFIKQNPEPIQVEWFEDEHEESSDLRPSFWWNNKRYFLDEFLRCHNNPWVVSTYPENIHGIELGNYYNPLFLELLNDEELNIYIGKK